jgi:hypothetical protein
VELCQALAARYNKFTNIRRMRSVHEYLLFRNSLLLNCPFKARSYTQPLGSCKHNFTK